jgi:trimeric autotransporter adhesin
MNDTNTRSAGSRLRRCSALAIAALCLLCANLALAQTFPANAGTLGAIPDNNPVGRSVTFDVSGATSIGDIRLSTTMNHTWVGDLVVTLSPPGVAPLAPGSFTLFQRIGSNTGTGGGDSSDLNGTYNFFDAAPGDMWGTAVATIGGTIPPGDYRTMAVGTGAPTSLSVPFGALSAAAINGTWTLYVQDLAGGDLGSITAASLTIAAKVPTDLVITKTNGVAGVNAGANTTYTIVATNNGANTAPNSNVTDNFPAACSSVNWTCVGAGGGTCTASGSGNINDTVNLPLAASVTYTATCAISAAATGTLANTATVTTGVSTFDTVPGDNSASDSDPITPFVTDADLSITKTNGVASSIPGLGTTYTITASNAGPAAATGSTVADTFPAACTSVSWTCVGAGGGTCTASGSGNINDTVNLPVGASVTYSAICAISATATGTLVNTATVATPGGITDPTPGNNSATDTDTLTPQANLGISKTDGLANAVPGTSTTYTIVASNAGPSAAPGSIVADTFPAACSSVNWTCVGAGGGSCAASGSGNISDSANLPNGASATYTATCAISAAATGTLANTATVAPTGGVSDPTPGNNSATDTDTLTPQADLAITKTDGVASAVPGTNTTYIIVASNAGPSAAPGSTVADTFPASCSSVSWTCVGAGGGSCAASGSGNISDSANLPSGGSASYTAICAISAAATGSLVNTATVATAGGISDPTPGNNSATDTDTLAPEANLSITKTNGVTSVAAGTNTTYTIVASNAGPSAAPGSTVADAFPADCTSVNWTCVGAGGGSCAASGSGNIGDSANLPNGASATYTAICAISAMASGTLANTATVATAAGITDPTPGNNSATDSDTVVQQADLSITKTNGAASSIPGTNTTYTIVASNAGPSAAPGSTVADAFPAACTSVNWTCVGAGGGTCAASGSGNISDSANLPSGGSASYTAICAISGAATGTLDNTATVAAAAGVTDPTPGNNSATDSDTLVASADLSITLGDAPDPVTAGSNLTYTANVTNAGPSDATGVTITMPLPAGTSLVSGSVSGGGSCAGNPVVCSVTGSIAPTVSRTATIVVAVAPSVLTGTVLTSTATVAAGSTDPNAANNSATTTTTVVTSADLLLGFSASTAEVVVNVPVTFTATSLNQGPSDAQNVVITVTLTPDFRYSSHTATGATCTIPQVGTTGAIVCTWAGASAPGVTRTLQVVAFSNSEGNTGVNASTSSNTPDPVANNNLGTVSVMVGFLVNEIPTLSGLALILLGLMLGTLGFVAVRRQA